MEWDTGLTEDDAFARRVRRYASDDPAEHAGPPRRYHLSSGYDLPLLRARVGATAIPAPPVAERWMDDVAVLVGLAPGRDVAVSAEVSTPDHVRWWSVMAFISTLTAFALRLTVT